MMRTAGIVVVDRFGLMRRASAGGSLTKREPSVALTAEEVFRRYRGFDGLAWPDLVHRPESIVGGLAALGDWPVVESYVSRLPQREECDVVALARSAADVERLRRAGWSMLGFDVGYFESEWSHFSVVLNEVLFGAHEDLRRFSGHLNEHLLFETSEEASALETERRRLAFEGKDVENAGNIGSIAVLGRDLE